MSLKRIENYIEARVPRQHVVVNVSKLIYLKKDKKLKDIIVSCDMINADGMPIVWASKLLGTPLPERVAGCDLFQELVKLCTLKGYRPFFFGARKEIVEKMVDVYLEKYPGLNVAGYRNGYFSGDDERQIAEQIRDSKADVLFLGFSSPKKENYLNKYLGFMGVPFCMGVGGSFDIIAGKTKRAPQWMQDNGLEWFYRFAQEPGRLWRRYAITNTIFTWMVLKDFFQKKCNGY
ncbi:MAG: WecB/TagA/CpsF family glycosyltransferase [bacterium]